MSNEIVEKMGKCPRCEGKGFYFEEPRDPNLIDICRVCLGNGKIKINSNMKVCGKCRGSGKQHIKIKTPFGFQNNQTICDRCYGKCIIIKENKE